MRWRKVYNSGFTLVEVLVVIAIIGILSSIVAINSSEANKQSRDEKRQSDLRSLQSAIEMYKNKYGRYPEACGDIANAWVGQINTDYECSGGNRGYIKGDPAHPFTEFMPVLPVDPKLNGTNSGYVYRTNIDGTVYKLMAMNTVESETVSYKHPLKSCDWNGTGDADILKAGWCTNPPWNGNNTPDWCKSGNFQFDHSYAVWGGFERLFNWSSLGGLSNGQKATAVKDTSTVICR
jgi:prepilin-type N-terminal cleavage/methylation domain-containing protein